MDPRDSLRSLVVRACRRRHLPHTWIIAQRVGIANRNHPNFADCPGLDIDELARLLEVSRDDVIARRHEAAGNGRVNYWGLAVPPLLLETTRRRRFAPGAFGAGVPMPVHDTRWDMRLLPFCPTTWQMLERRCGCCGRDQQWTVANGVDRCDNLRCVASLSKTPARPVPPELHLRLNLAAGICSPDTQERQAAISRILDIAALTEQQAFDLLTLLTMIVHGAKSGSFRISGPNTDPDDLLESLTGACDVLLDWPVPLKAIEIAARALPSRDRARFVAFVKTMRSEELARALPPTVLDAIVVALSPLRLSHAQGSKLTSIASCQQSKVSQNSFVAVRPAAEAAGTRRATLTTAWNDGLVTRLQRGHGPRLVPAFFLHEAMAIGDAMRERLSASAVAYRLGVPLYAVEQMLCLGLLTASGLRLSTDWDRHFLIGSDVPDFTDQIEAAVTRELSDPVRLVDALRSVPGRKPWGPVIKAMLAGVPFVIAEGDGPIFQRVSIDRVDMLRLCRLRFDHAAWPDRFSSEVILEDALEILNLASKHTAIVFSKRVTGRMPKRLAVDDVLDLAAVYVSTAELMARTSQSSLAIVKFLEDATLAQPFPGCWLRSAAERLLGLTHSKDYP
ncbi:hypothetical protein [uncultured Sphingomonas sp.]|uniref:hypothetical protein n=1 Tax=uncultured Sphingomonas sp. TaxID=158754 RepID=UPI0025D1A9A6|nr:hypothetical protein [uncultured Sphingomonas sp.]